MKKRNLGLAAFILLGMAASAQTKLLEKVEAKPGEAKIAYEKYELPNGLTVYIHEDHSDPMVHVEMTYKVGSNREHIGITGFAHFFEHMMFQGSKHIADEEHIKTVESAGGQMNGTTNTDRTNYYETLPSNMLETALWLESDRMGWLLPAVTQAKFESQRSAVKNEKDQNMVNQPYLLPLFELANKHLYPKGHPYSWPIIGYVDDLDRVGVQDLKNFFMRWYGPNNAILVIAGDVDPKATLAMVEKYFGPIQRGQEVKKMRVEPVVLQQDVFQLYADNVFVPLFTMYYPSVPNYHRDEPALDILADILGGGRNSVLYQRFVKNKFALQASASNPCLELAGEFQFQFAPNPQNVYDMTPGELQTMLYDSVKNVINTFDVLTEVKDEDIERIKATFESRFINRLESIQGKAGALTDWNRLIDGSYNLQDEIDRYKKVTKQDLKRVFEKYIKGKKALVTLIFAAPNDDMRTKSENPHPGEVDAEGEKQYAGLTYTEPVSGFDRSKPPVIPAARPSILPAYTSEKTPNGIQVIHSQSNEVPKVTMLFSIAGGKLLEAYDPKLLGLASITAGMMNEGTQLRTSEQIDAALDRLGSTINFSAGSQATTIFVSSLTKNVDATLAILEEMLYKPAFKKEDLDRLKEQTEQGLYNADKNPAVLSSKAFNILIYGDNILSSFNSGYVSTVQKITVEDVQAFYDKYYSPSVTNLVVVGNISMTDLRPKLAFLNTWKPKEVKLPAITEFPAKTPTTIYIVDKPGATQSQVFFGSRIGGYDYVGDNFKLEIANYPLGGSFNSRINLNLREEKGFTYGAYSFNTGTRYPGYWAINSSVRGNATDSAVREMYKELKNFYENGIKPDELATTRSSLYQADALRFETTFDKAGFLNQLLEYSLPGTYVDEQNKLLNTITVEELNVIIKKYLNPDEMIIVVVGDESDIKEGLKNLGIGKVTTIDPNKVKVKPLK